MAAALISSCKDWFPDDEVYEALREMHYIPIEFIDNELLEFRLYWRESGESRTSWNSKFLTRCVYQWQKRKYSWTPMFPEVNELQPPLPAQDHQA